MNQITSVSRRPLSGAALLSPRTIKYVRRAILYILLILAVAWAVLPLFWIFISSVKPDTETYAFEQTILPRHPTIQNYLTLFRVTRFAAWMKNSAVLATATTLVVIGLSSMAAYAMSHAAILMATFAVADEVIKTPAVGGILYVLIVIGGNAVALILEGVVVAVQVLRLEYYEFFGKFFSGDGLPFRPFSFLGKEKELT